MRFLTLLALLFAFQLSAQKTYWQQQVDYEIEVTLNDTLHTLEAFESVKYTNHSPDTLYSLYFHLWPNAYRDQTTPLAKQLLENGETDFYFSKEKQRGFIDHLDFKLNAEVCKWDYVDDAYEIAKLELNEPLLPGKSVNVSTPFRVKIPGNFSRLGHVGESYQISQWYPKPAVYDQNGWNPMPYLNQGEFYSEFGSFDVSITLSSNYVVAATGVLQNAEEMEWLDSIAKATREILDFPNDLSFPPSDQSQKTIRFTQDKIHDFAFFADKRFHVLKGEVELPYSKRKVTTWSFFTNNQAELWIKSPEYLHDATYYYSKWIGEYPYDHVSAVDGTIAAGGGMEYPMVTVIGESSTDFSLDEVITHEVGHNWFYGILGSNERKNAWMDEGINSYYEYRYLKLKYPDRKLLDNLPGSLTKTFDLNYPNKYYNDLGYLFMARENLDQPVQLHASRYTGFNYGGIVYGKTKLLFDYLESYLTTDTFDTIMKSYFQSWKFKHPQPEDLRSIFEKEIGKNLGWFFDDMIKTTKKIDFAIAKTPRNYFLNSNKGFLIKNKGEINSPAKISYIKNDSILYSKWVWPNDQYADTLPSKDAVDRIQIDPLREIPEINRRNNTYFLNKAAHRFEKLRFQFLGSVENENRTQVFFSPYFGWNNYDKTQIGIALYSPALPTRKFYYLIVPALGTGSLELNGFAKLGYNFFPDRSAQRITVGVNAKRFSYLLFPKNLMFNKLEPFIHVDFKNKNARSPFSHSINMRSSIIWLDWVRYDNKKKETQHYFVNELQYRFERNTTLHPLNTIVTLRQGNQFVNLSAEANFKVSYKRKNEGLSIRIFAGGFLLNFKDKSDILSPNPKFYLSNVTNNTFAYWLQKDYMFDENFIDRNGRDKYLARQVAKTDAAFRSITTFGATNKFMSAINITTTTYRFIPIQPFAALALLIDETRKAEFAAEFGLSAVIVKDMIEIHLPLVTTKNIVENQKVLGINKWYQRFTFTLKWQFQRPFNIVQRFLQ